ncbi:MAG: NAD-dependent epimerase/dehydratase family protein, partial [Chloroflexota bacterium]
MNRDEDADLLSLGDDEPDDEFKMENYGALKVLCEQAAEDVLPSKTTIVRPGLIVGPHDGTNRFTYWQIRVRKGGDVLVPGDGSTLVQVIDARDLAAFCLTLIENKTIGIFNACGPQEPHTLKDVIDTAKAISGSDANFVNADEAWLVENEVGPWMELPLWIPSPEGQAMMNVDVQRGMDAGMTFRSLEETIRDTYTWYDSIDGDDKEWVAGMASDKEAQLLAAWHEKKA